MRVIKDIGLSERGKMCLGIFGVVFINTVIILSVYFLK